MSAELAAAFEAVRRRIAVACARARRDPAAVRLIAVTKTVPAERVRDALCCGHTLFGENRVQEALAKIPEVGGAARWHMIGHLQRNKVRHAVGVFELIHAVDGIELAREIDRRAERAGLRQAILIQLNLAGEDTKSGVTAGALVPLLEAISGLEQVDPVGLMTVPPPVERAEGARRWFAGLRDLRDRAAGRTGLPLPELSMGMTDDFEVAVEEGATLVRIGRALFGERP